ncbi:alpha/beta hydrolase fold domain-containing protein [Streptomyces collinus]|uniref:alpha/beta hydrolase fold domain-containing protein n=1 Tax=Streptomyces collinus TaxID=42684 RepID=UPI0036B86AB6
MRFDPYLAAKLHLMENLNFHDMDDDMTARMAEFYRDPEPWTMPADVDTDEGEVPGPHGPVPYRLYRPSTPPGRVLVWAHGGGFATGDLGSREAHMVSAELAARAAAVVISVDYRLARHGVRHPVPVDDMHAVVIAALVGEVVGTGTADQVAVGGASAGAALAMASALRCRDADGPAPTALLLAYPFVHFPVPDLAPEISAELAILPPSLRTPSANVEWMVSNYVGRLDDIPVDALPGAAPLAGLPTTSIVVSEYDDLRGSADLLAKQLVDAGVAVRSYLAAGMPHGHLNRGTTLAQVDRSLDFLAEALHD